ncbi:MAG TPA: hypothetical protein VJS44_11405 [Pyrinomonadaceae bacterium]|nr:hypothetical protein [Pyrinomonadaceae bacterium]
MSEEHENFLAEPEEARVEDTRPFSHTEMVTCETCLRANPPTRPNCLYCGVRLPQSASNSSRRPVIRQPENWEEGYNVVLIERGSAPLELLSEVAGLLRLERAEAARILEASEPLPLARVDSPEEARLLEERLRAMGLSILVISDSDLMMKEESRRRVRGFDFEEEGIVAYAAGSQEVWRAAWSDFVLLILGRLVTRRVEVEERRKRGGSEVIEAREMTGDVLLFDLYTEERAGGWRVASDQFDFSCLGSSKALIASQNFASLVETLRERAPRLIVDDSYNRLRQALAPVWPPEERTESRGLRRERPGRFNTEAVMTSDNETQFTRYSRLRYALRLRESATGQTS